MENILTITNLKQNILEFNAGLEGINDNDMTVRLIIEANGVDFGFNAKRIKGSLWEVVIPPLPMLEKTAYPFRMDVISEGYFFDPLHGTMNVVGTHELYISEPKNRNIPPRTIEGLPKKHTAKPAGAKEVAPSADKVSPKVLKPSASKPEEGKPFVASKNVVADSMARLKALTASTAEEKVVDAEEKAVDVVVKAEKEETPKATPKVTSTPKKIEVGSNVASSEKVEPEKSEPAKETKTEKPKKEFKSPVADLVKDIVKKAEDKIEANKKKKVEPLEEGKDISFTDAIETLSKPTTKKRAPRKVKAKPKAGTIKKITENKEVISKPEDEVKVEAKNEEKVKDILAEEADDNKKVLTRPIKKKGTVTYH